MTAALTALAVAVIEAAPSLAVSPGSQRSVAFQQASLRCSTELRTVSPNPGAIDRLREAMTALIPEFGKWQQQEVAQLIDGMATSLRSLAGTLGEAADVQDHAIETLTSLHRNLEKARKSSDIVEIKEVLLTEIESAKKLLDEQTASQRNMQADYEVSMQDLEDRLAKAEEASQTDHLTMLANRAAFDYYAEAVVQKARHGDGIYSIAMIDLDDFKNINDGYGHIVGDLVLNLFAGLLKQHMGQGCFIARFGGDEFTAIMSTNADGLRRKLANLARAIERKPTKVVNENATILVKPVFSAGVTDILTSDSISQAISRADENLYASKREGKNRVTVDAARDAA